MKLSVKYLGIYLLSCVLFVSCNGRMLLLKRVHGKGYYFAVSQKPNYKQREHREVKKVFVETVGNAASILENIPCLLNSSPVTPVVSPVCSPTEEIGHHSSCIAYASKGNIAPLHRPAYKPVLMNTDPVSAKGGKKLLWIVLCLLPILCLVPVYLHDDKTATMNFWLTLALHFTLFGYAVFALLVILNVVDLR